MCHLGCHRRDAECILSTSYSRGSDCVRRHHPGAQHLVACTRGGVSLHAFQRHCIVTDASQTRGCSDLEVLVSLESTVLLLLLGGGGGVGLCGELLDGLLQGRGVGALQGVVGLVAVLEEEEGGDAADAQLKGQVGHVVGVELGKGHGVGLGEGVGVLGEEGRDGLAGAAPRGVGLQRDVGVGLDQLVELRLGLDVDDAHFGGLVRGYGWL